MVIGRAWDFKSTAQNARGPGVDNAMMRLGERGAGGGMVARARGVLNYKNNSYIDGRAVSGNKGGLKLN